MIAFIFRSCVVVAPLKWKLNHLDFQMTTTAVIVEVVVVVATTRR